jgi:hypothetical protein
MERCHLHPVVEHRNVAGADEAVNALDERLAVTLRDDRIGETTADRLLTSPAEDGLRLRVPVPDCAGGIDGDEGIVSGIDNRAGARIRSDGGPVLFVCGLITSCPVPVMARATPFSSRWTLP